jgi:SAM-dependent methyltransferase
LFARLKHEASAKGPIGRIMSTVLSIQPVGTVAFKLNVAFKKISMRAGTAGPGACQRVIEYPWVLSQIKDVKDGSLVLDLGGAESLLGHMLVSQGFRVIGLDIRDYLFRNKNMTFIKRNVMDTGLPNGILDAVIAVSTIEHVGLNEYTQSMIDDYGDMKAMKELRRILKPRGIMIITTPYIGNKNPVVSLG